jgi:hypothetical protein
MKETDDSPPLWEDKVELEKLLKRKAALVAKNPLRYYKPHPKQEEFHRHGDMKHRAVFAGNRFGKSLLGVSEDAAWLQGHRPWIAKDDPDRTKGIPQWPVKLLCVTTDWDMVDAVFTSQRGDGGKLWKALPSGFVKAVRRNHSGSIDTVECENGAIMRFDTVKSFATNPQGSESLDWDGIHFDEPLTEDHYKAVSRGMIDRGGKDWFTLTPIREPWIFDKFHARDEEGGIKDHSAFKNHWSIRGSTYDNPYLSPAEIADFEESLSEDERTCRIEGIPLELSGLVYKEFSYSKHVYKDVPDGWEAMDRPPREWPVIVSIDPHPQTPSMVLMAAVGPQQRIFFFDEIFQKVMIIDLCDQILAKTSRFLRVKYICDPLAFIKHPVTGAQSMAEDFYRKKVMILQSIKDLQGGIIRVKQELKTPDRLWFSRNLRETMFEFTHYVWDQKENKPRDKDDHAMECMYRLLLENPRYYDTKERKAPVPDLEIKVTRDMLRNVI